MKISEKLKFLYKYNFKGIIKIAELFIAILVLLIIVVVLFSNVFKNKDNNAKEIFQGVSSSDKLGIIGVNISGEVKKPGYYELTQGNRMVDLIEAAGGFTDEANKASVNLALILTDEMNIIVKNINDNNEETNENANLININTATEKELCTLPGIGSSYAKKIIEYREKNNGFKTIQEIQKVKGISEKKFENLKDLIFVS